MGAGGRGGDSRGSVPAVLAWWPARSASDLDVAETTGDSLRTRRAGWKAGFPRSLDERTQAWMLARAAVLSSRRATWWRARHSRRHECGDGSAPASAWSSPLDGALFVRGRVSALRSGRRRARPHPSRCPLPLPCAGPGPGPARSRDSSPAPAGRWGAGCWPHAPRKGSRASEGLILSLSGFRFFVGGLGEMPSSSEISQ